MEQNTKKRVNKKIILITSIILVVVISLGLSACRPLSYYEEMQSMPTLDSFNKHFTLADTKTDSEIDRIAYSYTFDKEEGKDDYYIDYCKKLTKAGFNLYDVVNQKPFNEETFSAGYIVCYDSKWVGTVWCFWESNEVEVGINTSQDSLVSEETMLGDLKKIGDRSAGDTPSEYEYTDNKPYDSAYGFFPGLNMPSPISVVSNIYSVYNCTPDGGYDIEDDSVTNYKYSLYSLDTFEEYINLLSKFGYEFEKDYSMSSGDDVISYEFENEDSWVRVSVYDYSDTSWYDWDFNYLMNVSFY